MRGSKQFIFASVLLVLGLLLTACGSQKSTADDQKNVQNNSGSKEQIVLKMADHLPTGHYLMDAAMFFQKRVGELTNGQVKFDYYPGGQLGSITEMAGLIKDGAVDLGFAHVASAGFLPQSTVTLLPSLSTNAIDSGKALTQLLNGELANEWESHNLKPLYSFNIPLDSILTSKKKITTINDVKGLKLGAIGGILNHIPEKLGATGTSIQVTGLYEALQRGVIDGNIMTMVSGAEYKLDEEVKFAYRGNFGGSSNVVAINLKKWNSLPENVQKALKQAGDETSVLIAKTIVKKNEETIKKFKDSGIDITESTPEQTQELIKKLSPLESIWLEDVKSKGVTNGPEILNAYKSAVNKAIKE